MTGGALSDILPLKVFDKTKVRFKVMVWLKDRQCSLYVMNTVEGVKQMSFIFV